MVNCCEKITCYFHKLLGYQNSSSNELTPRRKTGVPAKEAPILHLGLKSLPPQATAVTAQPPSYENLNK